MSLNLASGSEQINTFLSNHPQLLVGREAWQAANKTLEETDPETWGLTFTGISSPVDGMVVYQTVHSETNRAIVAAALINDSAAEKNYHKQKSFSDTLDKGCVCPKGKGNCDAWRLRCPVCVFANEDACKWDRKTCED